MSTDPMGPKFRNLRRKHRTPTETPTNRKRAQIILAFILFGTVLAIVGILLAAVL